MGVIFHVVSQSDWDSQADASDYVSPSLEQEGFIHCCTKNQIAGVLQRYYAGQTDLLLLHLNEDKLEAGVRYEISTGQELFPHVYGAINKTAVSKIEKVK